MDVRLRSVLSAQRDACLETNLRLRQRAGLPFRPSAHAPRTARKLRIREVETSEAARVTALINFAYEREQHKTKRPGIHRTTLAAITLLLTQRGSRFYCAIAKPASGATTDVESIVGVVNLLCRANDETECALGKEEQMIGTVGMLAVDPAWRGRGIARSLIAHCRHRAEESGATQLRLSVVSVSKTELVPLYSRFGFHITGRKEWPEFLKRSILSDAGRRTYFVTMALTLGSGRVVHRKGQRARQRGRKTFDELVRSCLDITTDASHSVEDAGKTCVRQGHGHNEPSLAHPRPVKSLCDGNSKVEGGGNSISITGPCHKCRLQRQHCYCANVGPRVPCRYRILLLVHYKEWNRASNSGSLVAGSVRNSEIFRFGLEEDMARLRRALNIDGPEATTLDNSANACVLFPAHNARPLKSWAAERWGSQNVVPRASCTSAAHNVVPRSRKQLRQLTIVVVDGTWSQARRMCAALCGRLATDARGIHVNKEGKDSCMLARPLLPVSLEPERVVRAGASVFAPLRAQSTESRCSTAEAVMHALEELDEVEASACMLLSQAPDSSSLTVTKTSAMPAAVGTAYLRRRLRYALKCMVDRLALQSGRTGLRAPTRPIARVHGDTEKGGVPGSSRATPESCRSDAFLGYGTLPPPAPRWAKEMLRRDAVAAAYAAGVAPGSRAMEEAKVRGYRGFALPALLLRRSLQRFGGEQTIAAARAVSVGWCRSLPWTCASAQAE